MSLTLIQQCCNGPGISGSNGGFYYYPIDPPGPTFSVPPLPSTGAPCWCGGAVNLYPYIGAYTTASIGCGYDHDRDWAVTAVVSGAILYEDFRLCSPTDGFPEPTPPTHVIIDAETADDIMFSYVPAYAPGTFSDISGRPGWGAWWSGLSKPVGGDRDSWRIYGHGYWSYDDEAWEFRVWSVSYDGDDPTLEVSLSGGQESGYISVPAFCTVSAGNVVTCEDNLEDTSKGRVRINGDGGTLVDNVRRGTYAMAFPSGGLFIWGITTGFHFGFTTPGTAGDNFEMGVSSFGWNHKLNCLELRWSNYNYPFQGWPLDNLNNFASQHTSLPSGNVVGNDQVRIYAVYPRSTLGPAVGSPWAIPIPYCAYPRPINPDAYEPPEPPPPYPDCSNYDGCSGFTAMDVIIEALEDCSLPDNAGDHPFEEVRNWSVINGSWTLDNVPTLDSLYIECVSNDKDGFEVVLADWVTPTTNEDLYAARGDYQLGYDLYFESGRDEYWVSALAVKIECVDGSVYIKSFHVLTQKFQILWDGSDYTILASAILQPCINFTDIFYRTGVIIDGECHSSNSVMATTFRYDCEGTTKLFTVRAAIGSVT